LKLNVSEIIPGDWGKVGPGWLAQPLISRIARSGSGAERSERRLRLNDENPREGRTLSKEAALLVGSLKLCRAFTSMDGRPSSDVEKPMRGGLHAETREPRPTEEQTSEGKKAKRGAVDSLRLTTNCRCRIRRVPKPLKPSEHEAKVHAL
jgi:hypothetical protein